MFSIDFNFEIVTYKSLNTSDIFIYTDSGGCHLVLHEYLGFFRKIKLNNLLNDFKRNQGSYFLFSDHRKGEEKKDAFIKTVISMLQRNGFKATLREK